MHSFHRLKRPRWIQESTAWSTGLLAEIRKNFPFECCPVLHAEVMATLSLPPARQQEDRILDHAGCLDHGHASQALESFGTTWITGCYVQGHELMNASCFALVSFPRQPAARTKAEAGRTPAQAVWLVSGSDPTGRTRSQSGLTPFQSQRVGRTPGSPRLSRRLQSLHFQKCWATYSSLWRLWEPQMLSHSENKAKSPCVCKYLFTGLTLSI